MSNNLLRNKKGIIFGALDENSIAWKTAEKIKAQGGEFILTNAPVALRMGKLNDLAKKTNSIVVAADATRNDDLENLIDEVVAAEKRDGSKINLTLNVQNLQKLEVRPQAIKRALTNLISNSKRYGKNLDVKLLQNKNSIIIMVDDDGPGIPIESHEDVFKAFFRVDPSRNPETGGTGLGLTIARDIARSHGGELELEESPTGGLRAIINIPV